MTLYWYSTVDANWDTLGNWWQNSNHTMSATVLPGSNDTCVLLGSVAPTIDLDDGIFTAPEAIDGTGLTGGSMLTVVSMEGAALTSSSNINITGNIEAINSAVLGANDGATLEITGYVYIYNSASIGGAECNVVINGNAYVYGTCYVGVETAVSITGDVYCFDYATIASNTYITGNAYCRGASNTAGTILGNADYWDEAFNNYADIGGNWTYHSAGLVNFGNTDPLGLQSGSIEGNIVIVGATAPELLPI